MKTSYTDTLALAFLSLILVAFIIGRGIICWYFKINKINNLLEEIRDLLNYQKKTLNNIEKLLEENKS